MTHIIPSAARASFLAEAGKRLLITDGAFGTEIQNWKLSEADYAGDLGLARDQKGNNDILALTKPEDLILIETVFDTLNATAGIMAVRQLEAELGREVPIMLSMTLTDLSGRNLSGHTVEAFWHAVRHARPLTIGLNCSFGATQLRPHVKALSAIADTLIMVYPNAGLPNELGEYDEMPPTTAGLVKEWADAGQVNVLGGCCGSTPAHIAAMAVAVAGLPPRAIPAAPAMMRLAGLEPFVMAD